MRICSNCKIEKHIDCFGNWKKGKDGKEHRCLLCKSSYGKEYRKLNPDKVKAISLKSRIKRKPFITKEKKREYKLKTRFGMSMDDFNNRMQEQMDVCAICFKEETAKNSEGIIKPLSVDHCHLTGKVRGLLCDFCNHGLGNFRDNIFVMNSAIKYITDFCENEQELENNNKGLLNE